MRFNQTLITCIVSSAVTGAAVLGFQPMMARGGQNAAEAATAGSGFSYQGQLKKNGAGVTASCAFEFMLFDAASGGSQVGDTLSKPGVAVHQGLFTVELDFFSVSFQGDERWLQPHVQCPGDSGMTALPRQKVATVPYAIRALQNWGLSGNAGTLPSLHFIGTTDPQGFEIRTGNQRAWSASRPRTVFVSGVTYTGTNQIGGASQNVISTGTGNVIAGGGGSCWPSSGCANTIAGTDTVQASIGGGGGNQITASHGSIGGGMDNLVSGRGATVAGGVFNRAQGPRAAIAGGSSNAADAASGEAFVGGGYNNLAVNASNSVIAGGFQNSVEANFTSIGGGGSNYARAVYATVPGGYNNIADGEYSFAAGSQALASHDGTFVWADSQGGQIQSTAKDQVVIRAQGGLRWAGSGINASGSPAVRYSGATCPDTERMSIDLPLLNGNPNAVIVVTATTNDFGQIYTEPVGVYYNSSASPHPGGCPTDKWALLGLNPSATTSIATMRFNLWFVLP